MLKNQTFLFLILAVYVQSCVFFGPSKQELYLRAYNKKPYDVIIVPGIPYDSGSTDWNMAMKGRIFWSKHLYEKGIAKNIIYSGSAVYTPYVEGKIMSMFGEKIGIPKENIFAETKAEHSTENIYYSYYLAKKLGFEKIAVATDPFQAKMLKSYPRKMKVEIDFIPFVIDSLSTMPNKEVYPAIDAEQAKISDFIPIADRESRFKRFWGTMGKNIKRVEEDVRNNRSK